LKYGVYFLLICTQLLFQTVIVIVNVTEWHCGIG